MNWKISNGVLFAENQRIILAHVTHYRADSTLIVLNTKGGPVTINVGSESGGMQNALDAHFTEVIDLSTMPMTGITETRR